jgi:uncharacterized Rmd1/YagE family protein
MVNRLSTTWKYQQFRLQNTVPLVCRVISYQGLYRAMATHAADPNLPDPSLKPKRKAATPLRRSTSASLPIRSNPTPTRGNIQTIFTLSTAERYVLSRLGKYLPPKSRTLHESWWIPKWGESGHEGEVFVFANGSFVCWGLEEREARRFAAEFVKPDVEVAPLNEAETEELEFVTDPTELGGVPVKYLIVLKNSLLPFFYRTGPLACKAI